jgi:hypothetical protein
MKLSFAQLAGLATMLFLFSVLLHYPLKGGLPVAYSDVVAFFIRYEVNHGWFPYVQYQLEYPVGAGLLLYLASAARNFYVYYLLMSAFAYAGMLTCLWFTLKMSTAKRVGLFVIFTPVFVYYSVYSFDWVGAVLTMGAIYFAVFRKDDARPAGFLMGTAVAVRFFPLALAPFIWRRFEGRERWWFTFWTAGSWAIFNLPVYVANPGNWLYTYTFQASYLNEDSWLALVPYVKYVSLLLIGTAFVFLWLEKLPLQKSCFLMMTAFFVFSFKFPPQYMIVLLPLAAITVVNYPAFIVASLLDAAIIILWFVPGATPYVLSNPIQLIAYVRQGILFALMAYIIASARLHPDAPEDRLEELHVEVRTPALGPYVLRRAGGHPAGDGPGLDAAAGDGHPGDGGLAPRDLLAPEEEGGL